MSVYIENKIHTNLTGLLPNLHIDDTKNLAKKSVKTVIFWRKRSKSRKELASLNDYLLADIGYTREEAQIESAKPFWK